MTDTQRFNPYADFGGTRTDARFIGRESELRMIASRVFGAGGYGSVAVIGLPRVGKSSSGFRGDTTLLIRSGATTPPASARRRPWSA